MPSVPVRKSARSNMRIGKNASAPWKSVPISAPQVTQALLVEQEWPNVNVCSKLKPGSEVVLYGK